MVVKGRLPEFQVNLTRDTPNGNLAGRQQKDDEFNDGV